MCLIHLGPVCFIAEDFIYFHFRCICVKLKRWVCNFTLNTCCLKMPGEAFLTMDWFVLKVTPGHIHDKDNSLLDTPIDE